MSHIAFSRKTQQAYLSRLLWFITILLSILIQPLKASTVITWKVQSNKFANTLPYQLELDFSKKVAELTDNQLIIEILPLEGFVNTRSAFNATRTQIIDGMFMQPQYWEKADPVFAIMGDLVAAWNSSDEYYHWLTNNNGIRYLDKSYSNYGLKLVSYMIAPLESLVSNHPIRNIEDIVNKRMRTPPGMVTEYFKLIKAKPRLVPIKKIKKALLQKQISITDLSNIVINDSGGLYEHAKHTNYPGFHSLTFLDFVVSQKSWLSLSQKQRDAVNSAATQWSKESSKAYKDLTHKTLKKIQQDGVNIYKWSEEDKRQARKLALPVWRQYAAKTPRANEVVQALIKHLKSIGNL